MAKGMRPSIGALDDSPSHLLHRALQLALDLYALNADAGALTQRQFAVLCAVAAEEGLSQTGLVRATGIDRSTLADMVARMIAKGLLARERSVADGRANTVRLTELGRTVLDAAAPRVHAADQRLLGILGGKKREAFVEALRKLAKASEHVAASEDVDTPVETKTKRKSAALDASSPDKKGAKKSSKKKDKAKVKSAAKAPRAPDPDGIGA
jgi:DNA-binding MarR family transcriptional regulator